MLYHRKPKFCLASREEGIVSLEMVILFPVIFLIILAILEFGHLWIVRQTLTIATREGARAAVVFYEPASGTRLSWATNEATETVTNFLQNTAGWGSGEFTVPAPDYNPNPDTGGLVGGTLTVRAQATNALLVMHMMIRPVSVTAETTMRFE